MQFNLYYTENMKKLNERKEFLLKEKNENEFDSVEGFYKKKFIKFSFIKKKKSKCQRR